MKKAIKSLAYHAPLKIIPESKPLIIDFPQIGGRPFFQELAFQFNAKLAELCFKISG